MKAAQTLATTALLCTLPTSIDALAKVETRNLDALEDDPSRGLMHVVSNLDNLPSHCSEGIWVISSMT